MKKDNLDYLKDQVKFTGFGDALEAQLLENIANGKPEFQISHEHDYGRDKVEALLYFKQSDQGNYFFNKYDLTLNKDGGESLKQTFHLNPPVEAVLKTVEDSEGTKQWINSNISLKEGYNLLSGRAINKDLVNREGEGYNGWIQLNFKETEASGNYKREYFSEKYGYDLDKAVSAHPIKELTNQEDKQGLLESLQKGNRQAVTFDIDGAEQKRFIEANPKFKTVNVYEGNRRIRQAKKEEQTEGKSAKQSQKMDAPGEADESAPKGKRRKSKTQGIS